MNGEAGKPITFRWDAAWICQGQGIKGYPQHLGTIDFGNGTKADLPELYGVATVTYPFPKKYTVRVDISATCYDTGSANCSNTCNASGSADLIVAPRSISAANLLGHE